MGQDGLQSAPGSSKMAPLCLPRGSKERDAKHELGDRWSGKEDGLERHQDCFRHYTTQAYTQPQTQTRRHGDTGALFKKVHLPVGKSAHDEL